MLFVAAAAAAAAWCSRSVARYIARALVQSVFHGFRLKLLPLSGSMWCDGED